MMESHLLLPGQPVCPARTAAGWTRSDLMGSSKLSLGCGAMLTAVHCTVAGRYVEEDPQSDNDIPGSYICSVGFKSDYEVMIMLLQLCGDLSWDDCYTKC